MTNRRNGRIDSTDHYYLHIDPDLRFGFLGQPWEQTITVFGRGLIDAFKAPPFLVPAR